jgi:hypothetical protein
MNEPHAFLSRWARRKREAQAPSPTGQSPLGRGETGGSRDPAHPGRQEIDPQYVDLESLPSIDSITAATDVSGFLRSGVPAEWTRSALRRAWTRDPAIRDFIGIAENQWDFNDPAAIAGFGRLSETDDVPALLAQALGRVSEIGEALLTDSVVAGEPGPVPPPDAALSIDPARASRPAKPAVAIAATETAAPTDSDARPHGRRHGSALPR